MERIHAGSIAQEPRFRVLVTCRYHACEMMTNYFAEGMLESILGGSAAGAWFRKNVELLLIPFVDKDGVEDGDQGKNRIPVDHKSDREGIYPETAALRRFIPEWRNGKPLVDLDLHDPTMTGQVIYTHSFRRKDENLKRSEQLLNNPRRGAAGTAAVPCAGLDRLRPEETGR